MNKEQEKQKQMLQRKFIYFILSVLTLFISSSVNAGLYDFTKFNEFDEKKEIPERQSPPQFIINYRQKMRDNINMLANYAKLVNQDFKIIVHGADELLSISNIEIYTKEYNLIRLRDAKKNKTFIPQYSIEKLISFAGNVDAISVTNILCGENQLEEGEDEIKKIYIEKCIGEEQIDYAIRESVKENAPLYIFSHIDNAFKNIKKEIIINESAKNILTLNDAKNISILTDDSNYADKYAMMEDIMNSNYDIVVIKPLFRGNVRYTKEEINSLKAKKSGFRRLIIAQMSLSETNPQDYFWREDWKIGNPYWLRRLSFVDENAIITEYWNNEWREIISSHFKSIMDTGFDGAWLTGAENFKYYEKLTPLY